MFDEKMAAAVETAQKRLMNTTERESVLVALANDLSEMDGLVKKLDPSKIDFDRGGLERIKAVGYWNRFEENYPRIKAVFERLERYRKILHNSITTAGRFESEYLAVFEKFSAVSEDERDTEYMQQAAVAENMRQLLRNTVTEHEAALEHLTRVLTLMTGSLEMAIYLAKQKAGRTFDDTFSSVSVLGDVTSASFQAQYRQLSDALGK